MTPAPRPACVIVLLGCAFAALTGGCGTVVTVDSLARPDANALSYELRNASPLLDPDSLRYRETADYVRTALSGRGMFEAPPKTKPDVVIEVEFDMSPPIRRSETLYFPRASSTGESSGEDKVQVYYTVYEKHLRLVAESASAPIAGHPPVQLWSVDVVSEGGSRDLRKHLPTLVAATIEFVGRDSQGPKTIRIKDTDADVVFVKRGM